MIAIRRLLFLSRMLVLAACALPALALAQQDGGPARPNVVLILADDLGIMDVCSYARRFSGRHDGCFYETPNIDALADKGTSFVRAYTAPLCSPSRATILSGNYGAVLGFNNAFAMRDFASYASTGKWPPAGYLLHDGVRTRAGPAERALVSAVSSSALVSGQRADQGADILSFAEYASAHDSAFIGKWHLGGGGAPGYGPANQGFEEIAFHDEGWSDYFDWRHEWTRAGATRGRDYLTDEVTSQAVDWIDRRKSSSRPFILYVSHFAVHGPFQAKAAAVKKFEQKTNRGWLGHDNAVYAAMLESLDESVGEIVGALERAGLRENTMVIFMSDNGGVVMEKGEHITSNRPFRGEKRTLYEGGIRVPLIVSWPARLSSDKVVTAPVHAIDIYPTIVDAAGYGLDTYRGFGAGQSLLPLAGKQPIQAQDQRPFFFYDPFYRELPIDKSILETTPKVAVIEGQYKLIQYHLGYTELYDLQRDPFERSDISAEKPLVVIRLRELSADWEKTIPERYRPRQNPKYNPAKEGGYPPYRDYYLQMAR